MTYKLFGTILLAMFVCVSASNGARAMTSSLTLDQAVTSVSSVLMADDPALEKEQPRVSPPAKPAEPIEKAEPEKATAKAPSFFERAKGFFGKVASYIEPVKKVAAQALKEVGAEDIVEYGKEVYNGYVDLAKKATVDYNAKQDARKARGEEPGIISQIVDVTTTSVIPSFIYSMKAWGWPIIKAVLLPEVEAAKQGLAPQKALPAAEAAG
jgi:hypothetical protein